MRFAQLVKGTRAVKVVPFPIESRGATLSATADKLASQALQPDSPKSGGSEAPDAAVRVGIRVLTGLEAADCLQKARAYAIARGVNDPKDGEPIYDLAVMVHTLWLACVDPDSSESDRKPFFDSAEQIFEHLDRDRIFYLYEIYLYWQDECSPQVKNLSPEEFYARVVAMSVAEDELPFVQMRPGLRWICTRTLAALYLSSLTPKSASTLDSELTGTTSTPTQYDRV